MRGLREAFRCRGYIHANIMPGADPALILQSGLYANRLSVNIEVAHAQALPGRQADAVVRLFSGGTAAPADTRLSPDLHPKAAWALRNMDRFPVEVTRAAYAQLLRVPGIGITYARRVAQARRHGQLTHDTLGKPGISLKRCAPFITCNGRMAGPSAERAEQLSPLPGDSLCQAAGQ